MKAHKFLALALALALCLGLLPTAALAAGDFTIVDGVLTRYTGKGGDVSIPQGVTAIGKEAFSGCANVTAVVIPESVTTIDAQAFYKCERLASVSIPYTVTTIRSGAFSGCTSLTRVFIPYGVTTIAPSLFEGCTSLQSVTIPLAATSIGNWAFYKCRSLTDIAIPDLVTTIGKGAFNQCASLQSVTIPAGVTVLDEQVFYNCTGLKSVSIPAGVTAIGKLAFGNCSSLQSVAVPQGVTVLDQAFDGCSALTSLTIPPVVDTISLKLPATCEILGAPGSWAETWAKENGLSFVPDRPYTTTPSITAYASTQKVDIDGKTVEFQMYALVDSNGGRTNYIKLRDLAYALNGTDAQFQVGYAGGVLVTSKAQYTPTGSEMSTPFSGDRIYRNLSEKDGFKLNGVWKDASHFTLLDDNGGGYTYFKLRDLGELLGFNIGWSQDRGVFVETNKPYNAAD